MYEPARQLYRTPFLCGFKAGWFRFMLCTVHIAYGAGKKNDENRQVEIEGVARFLAKRADEAQAWSENMILAKGYCVSTVGLDEAVVREYIRNQEVSDRQQEEFDV